MARLTRREVIRKATLGASGLAFGSAALADTAKASSGIDFPPLAICVDRTVHEAYPGAGFGCASIDGGSCDFDGTTCNPERVRTREVPGCNYPIGTTKVTLTVVDSIRQTDTCTADVTVLPLPPVVKLNPSKTVVDEGDIGSIGTENTIYSGNTDRLNWDWTQTKGPDATILAAGWAMSFRAPNVAEPTEITFKATATDELGQKGTGSITITIRPVIIPVDIDIQPDDDVNTIPNGGKIPVALFGSEDFNPTSDVITSSLRFGSEATVSNGGGSAPSKTTVADVNDDGIDDLLIVFPVEGTGFEPGDTVGKLTGLTPEDYDIVGTDSVSVAT